MDGEIDAVASSHTGAAMSDKLKGQALAEQTARTMIGGDRPGQHYGFEVLRVAPGESVVAMTIEQTALNAFGTSHGGVIFMLADTAFSIACNSHGDQAVAQHCSITFVRPAVPGDRLIAFVVERNLSRRSSIYDCTVTREVDGKVVAEFRGNARILKREDAAG